VSVSRQVWNLGGLHKNNGGRSAANIYNCRNGWSLDDDVYDDNSNYDDDDDDVGLSSGIRADAVDAPRCVPLLSLS